jgi:hypothetical protein
MNATTERVAPVLMTSLVALTGPPEESEVGHLFYRVRSFDDVLPVVLVRVVDGAGYYRRADLRNFVEMGEFTNGTMRQSDAGAIIGIGWGLLARYYGQGEVLAALDEMRFDVSHFGWLKPAEWDTLTQLTFDVQRAEFDGRPEPTAFTTRIEDIFGRCKKRAEELERGSVPID